MIEQCRYLDSYLDIMLQNCLYHVCDFIVVPHVEKKKNDATSLQFMCSVNIAKYRRVPPAGIPPSLFPFLLECAIINGFALYIKGVEHGQFDGIGHLLTHWPNKSLNLRECFPIKLPPWIFHKRVTFGNRVSTVRKFMFELVKELLMAFVMDRRHFHELKHLDISGVGCFNQGLLNPGNLVKLIEQYSSCEASDQRSVSVDVNISGDSFEDFCHILKLNRSSHSRLKIYFDGLLFQSSSVSLILKAFSSLKKNAKVRLNFLQFSLCELPNNLADEIASKIGQSLKALEISYPAQLPDNILEFHYLSRFESLKQLSLAGINLNGKLKPLHCMISDLNYLSLVGCQLKSSDLLHLQKHLPTLLQLDLSENSLGEMEIMTLIKLSKHLHQILILDLENCKLQKLDPSLLRLLMEALICNCPSLRILLLLYNDFSFRDLHENLILLTGKRALLQLHLTVPSEAYMSDDYDLVERRIQDVRVLFENAIAEGNSSLSVIWEEHPQYSNWFYCL